MRSNPPQSIPHMPLLEGTALQLYELHFGLSRYNSYNECRQSTLLASNDIPKPWTCLHQPRHDAESYFWMISFFLLQAIPAEDSDKPDHNLEAFRAAMQSLRVGAAAPVGGGKMRSVFFTYEEEYRLFLHAGLTSFAPLIAELGEQVYIEWQFLSKQPPSDHVHEAFRRILLKWIVKLEDAKTPYPILPAVTRLLKDPLRDDSLSILTSNTSGLVPTSLKQSGTKKRKREE